MKGDVVECGERRGSAAASTEAPRTMRSLCRTVPTPGSDRSWRHHTITAPRVGLEVLVGTARAMGVK